MTLLEARQLARTLMNDHGLAHWRFMFDHAKRRFGCCHYRRKLLTLSRSLTLLNPPHQVRETILHEIAHALAPGDGHGRRWRARCIQLGAQPRSRFNEKDVTCPPRTEPKYLFGCPSCDWWVRRHRLTTRPYICTQCRTPLAHRDLASARHFTPRRTPDGRLIKRFAD